MIPSYRFAPVYTDLVRVIKTAILVLAGFVDIFLFVRRQWRLHSATFLDELRMILISIIKIILLHFFSFLTDDVQRILLSALP